MTSPLPHRPLGVDRPATLLHPHVRAARAAAERLLAGSLHLDRLPHGRDELARLEAHVVVAGEVTGVVVRDGLHVGLRRETSLADELGEQLGVVDDLVGAAEVRVLVRERVEAVRAAGDDLRHALLVERFHVLLGVCLEDVFVAHPAGRVARARLARPEDREVDAGLLQ